MTIGPFSPGDKSAMQAARMYGYDRVAGKATKTGVDADGNPVYSIKVSSIFDPQQTIALTGVTPARWYAGVLVQQPNTDALCVGERFPWLPGDGWVWTVYGETIDWKEC